MRDAAPSERRYSRMSRRAALTGAAPLTLSLSACGDKVSKPAEGDMTLGAAEGAKGDGGGIRLGDLFPLRQLAGDGLAGVRCQVCRHQPRPLCLPRTAETSPVEVATAGFLVARCAGRTNTSASSKN